MIKGFILREHASTEAVSSTEETERVIKKERILVFLFMFVHSILSCPTWSKTKGVTVQWNNIRSFLWGRDYRKLHLEVYFSPPETLRHCWPYFALLGHSSTSWNPNKCIFSQVQTLHYKLDQNYNIIWSFQESNALYHIFSIGFVLLISSWPPC